MEFHSLEVEGMQQRPLLEAALFPPASRKAVILILFAVSRWDRELPGPPACRQISLYAVVLATGSIAPAGTF